MGFQFDAETLKALRRDQTLFASLRHLNKNYYDVFHMFNLYWAFPF